VCQRCDPGQTSVPDSMARTDDGTDTGGSCMNCTVVSTQERNEMWLACVQRLLPILSWHVSDATHCTLCTWWERGHGEIEDSSTHPVLAV
jgi:hypothetical protein